MSQFSITRQPPTAAAVQEFFRRASPLSRRERFHGTVSRLPCGELDGLTEVRDDRVNVYARDETTGEMVGAASALLLGDRAAELAVWVADRFQRQGVATALTGALLTRLSKAGLREVHAFVEISNAGALALWRKVFPNAPVARYLSSSELFLTAPLADSLTQTARRP
jgi:ribosomal protein S18 acetylase RimI-like enzyme